ncbi:hypothetical protein ACWGE0_22035 [Lentzea sp. NPDC054927]
MNKYAVAGGAATAVSGLVVQTVVQPTSTVPDTMWSYPLSPNAFVLATALYAVFHVLVLVGVLAFARSGAAGTSRTARTGTALAVAGTGLLCLAELASILFSDDLIADPGPSAVGAAFGVAVVLTAVGFLLCGATTLRAGVWQDWRRLVPLTTGIWSTLLVGIAMTKALPAGVAVYGVCMLLLGVALREPRKARTTAEVLA